MEDWTRAHAASGMHAIRLWEAKKPETMPRLQKLIKPNSLGRRRSRYVWANVEPAGAAPPSLLAVAFIGFDVQFRSMMFE